MNSWVIRNSFQYSHLDRVFLTVVNQGNSLVVLLDAVNCCHTRPAIAAQIAPCVYWPPFSRTPGTYPLM